MDLAALHGGHALLLGVFVDALGRQLLREFRFQPGLFAFQLVEAALLGIDQRVYSNYELGKRSLPLRHLVTLAEYVGRMQEGQKYIYFASGDTVEAIDHMPQTELLKDHSMEILYFTDKADEFLSDILHTYQDKPFRSAIDGDLELGDEQKPDETEHYKESFGFIKEVLGDRVDTVKASTKLKTHPVCLTSGEGVTFEMEKYFTAVQPELGLKAKRILELNVDHPAFMALETARVLDPERAKKYAEILYNQALLVEGMPLEDPVAFANEIAKLMK